MRLHSLSIEGFRRHYNTRVRCSDATFLIGTNNVGKSSILKAIEYLLSDKQKMPSEDFYSIWNDSEENEQICSEVVITGEFRNVPKEAFQWKGFNRQRIFEYEANGYQEDTGLSIFYRKTFKPDQKYKVEMKQFQSVKKDIFNDCKKIQDYIENGLSVEVIRELFPSKELNQNMTASMEKELEAFGNEELFDINHDVVEWFENPGGIAGNVSHRLPKFLLISDKSKGEELSANNGALMQTLKHLFEDVRDESENFRQAQHYLNELAKELDPNDENSEFANLLTDLNRVVGDVFPETAFSANANLSNADQVITPNFDVQLGSNINTSVDYQGAGVIRSAVFAMLRYRSIRENQRKGRLREYIRPLLIAFEEPEIYLHPQAAKQMRDTIYDLSLEANNQIICTTHSPYMIDLSKKANQVLNSFFIEKSFIEQAGTTKNLEMVICNPFNVSDAFRKLLDDDKSYIKMLLKIDDDISKVFFTKNVLIIEGDTEEVVVRESLTRMPEELYKEFSYNWEVVRARGKATIISLVKYLRALGLTPFVIHDRDKGEEKAFSFNKPILDAVGEESKVIVLRECMEDLLGYSAPSSNKPYSAFKFINENWGDTWEEVNPEWKSIIESLISSDFIYDQVAATVEND
ncbi:AAA family ATPase [Alkalibacillus haloalkaliphilus]|uniref:ATP-dependent endonuclease n=1 Tax=Alkalibacillus haloalkaliphilus TaxID=94136 RepID=A0A511W7F6_9BACI|nr:AAA family ATPase [Alkalibacillus haloalkaliphilus]GEN46258.1 ATP-dependent endonuclease [Alkalibacillus haloalkaliphilus]